MRARVEASLNRSDLEALAPGEVLANRYVVHRTWGDHPLGSIYVCADLEAGPGAPEVWVQRLRPELAEPGVRARVVDLHAHAGFDAPMLILPRDAGLDHDGRPFVVMAPRAGVTLSALLAESPRPLPFDVALGLIEQIAGALIPAHAARRVHGGLDPASVIVERDPEGTLRLTGLLGFGVVAALERGGKARTLPLVLTPAHVAPELVRGAVLGPAVDVYALGVLLWQLVHGAPPFRGPTLRVLDAHLHQRLPDRPLPVDAPPGFDASLRRMLAKDPNDRFADAPSLLASVRACVAANVPDLSADLVTEPELTPVRPDPRARAIDPDDDAPTRLYARGLVDARPRRPWSGPLAVAEPDPNPSRARAVALASLAIVAVLLLIQALLRAP